MTPRDLFKVILKCFSLFFLFYFIAMIPQVISSFAFAFQVGFDDVGGIISIFLWSIIIIALYGYVTFQLLYRTGRVVDWLKLDKGFDADSFSVKLSSQRVILIGLVVMAGVILVREIPNFCGLLYNRIQTYKYVTAGTQSPEWPAIIASGVKIIIGLLLLGERVRISRFMAADGENG